MPITRAKLAVVMVPLAVIGAGILWQRHESAIGSWLRSCLPAPLRELVAHRASA